jgi:putative methionine-R-sulfoxide reductase with GAF domain
VCGTAAAQGATILVPDVHDFPGHIACDPESRSELVVPLIENGSVLGVLDLDSPLPARFDDMDRQGCEQLVALFVGQCRQYSNCHKGAIFVTAHGISDKVPSRGGGAK